ncbi:ATP-dependent DNA helicase RecG [Lactobacillus sp. YT155]|uniref:ATP-dependent DNA helicase RecG n=1 Tax=Lactobacillus sp. YT155 TaxID=3060955 RepID=UPI00265F7530|nr:ATP-dependent DNA helicase RecG [Lactobacillus sp. YT155]MDO1605538.1 ATP-dependent DNA helicase RecG [Lactobacillus sp. YT155]
MKSLNDNVAVLKGVGTRKVEVLQTLGISTIYDLLYYFPFRYEDLMVKSLDDIVDQEKTVLEGTVASDPVVSRFGYKKNRLNVRLLVENESVMVTFFNQPWLKDKFITGEDCQIYGKWDQNRRSLTGMKVLNLKDNSGDVDSVYSVNKNIRQSTLKALIKQAYDEYQDEIHDFLPQSLIAKYKLVAEKQLVKGMHFPDSVEETDNARRTAIFREFFLFECGMQNIKHQDELSKSGVRIKYDQKVLTEFINSLEFKLTDDQQKVLAEILKNMNNDTHMNRLLQGDVGSGKTIVATIALFAAVTGGYQAALMVPTEILAQQHFDKISAMLAPYQVSVDLLVGSLTAKQRQDKLARIESGKTNIIIGTHSLIQKDVKYKNLGFAVIDEQHRFGVDQRKELRLKGENPDILAMTATPIPRTLAITTYGDMSLSIIKELPKGRLPVETYWLRSNKMDQLYDFVARQLNDNGQVFAVTPLISESEKIDLQNAEAIYENFVQVFGAKYQVALLHGQMNTSQKDEIMQEFKEKKIDILVSTTVIEVGVDIPNANVMVIFDANRFGLSQLHQLRGRVGRGNKQSYCILIADPKNETAIQRMRIMTQSNDGFVLAQKDLELRGQGDLLGNQQSGLPNFKVGNPVTDFNILQAAQLEAQTIFESDPNLNNNENKMIKLYLKQKMESAGNFD